MPNENQKKPTMAEALGTRMDETKVQTPTEKIKDAEKALAELNPVKRLAKATKEAVEDAMLESLPEEINDLTGKELEKFQQSGKKITNPAEVEPEQTENEIVHQALLEEQTEQVILSQEPPQRVSPSEKSSETTPTQPEIVTTSSLPGKEKQVIPALSIDLLHATENSTPASPEPPVEEKKNDEIDLSLRRLKVYITSGEYSVTWVQLHITSISSFPRVLPTPTIWDIPNDYDVAKLVYGVVLQPGFIDTVWPYLRLLLGSSKDNVNWAAGVLTTIALFEAIKLLPNTNKSAEEYKGVSE